MKSFHFSWCPQWDVFFQSGYNRVNLNSNSPVFIIPNGTSFSGWYINATGTENTTVNLNLNLKLILSCNDGNQPLKGVKSRLELVNFLDASKSSVQEVKGDIPDVNEFITCTFRINLLTLQNEGYTVLCDGYKRLCFKCTLTIPDQTQSKANNRADADAIAFAKIPDVVNELFASVLDTDNADSCSDITLITSDSKRFKAHRCFLARRSAVFRTMFLSDKFKEAAEGEVNISDIDSVTLTEILRYIYTESVNHEALKVVAPEALNAVEKYMLPEALKTLCHQALKERLTTANAVDRLQLAYTYDLNELKIMAVHIIVENFAKIRKQESWSNLLKNNPILVDEVYEEIFNRFETVNIAGCCLNAMHGQN